MINKIEFMEMTKKNANAITAQNFYSNMYAIQVNLQIRLVLYRV